MGGGTSAPPDDSGRGATVTSATDSDATRTRATPEDPDGGGTAASPSDEGRSGGTLASADQAGQGSWARRDSAGPADVDSAGAEGATFADFDSVSAEPEEPTAAGPAAPCPVHGRAAHRRVAKRSPARRLSFTLENPSPLLVEYYLKHPEERLQVLENAAATATESWPPRLSEGAPEMLVVFKQTV
ncbi:guanine nucleotide-binding protein G(s) subunit alpha isoforms XLas-like [Pollicipes pollicipes]|uniref:guanine nucleotide-binding protein G(s) subunit alpha isoforms XLas-like n=1 Tax=Pollicipes pollicipes TaxID=41117 RepID=UPI001884B11A|nr:guanine nucleotide-binding protein G(s) subunit alpha isoforms XLas-like [Pollicipes pollicipes]